MRIQFVPFPLIKPRQPSSRHIFIRPFPTDSLYSSRPALCIWKRIFSLSRGDTTVLDTAPATPPAQNAAKTGCASTSRSCRTFGPYLGLRFSFSDCSVRVGQHNPTRVGGEITHSRHFLVQSSGFHPRPEAQRVSRSQRIRARTAPSPTKTIELR